MKQALVEDGAEVKAGQPLIVLTNAALQLQVAWREADTAGQINAQADPKIRVEEARFTYKHDLLDIAHQISKLKGDLARPKVLRDANAIALPIYQQEQEAYAYKLKLRDATASSGEAAKPVRATQLRQPQDTLIRPKESSCTAAASLDAPTIRAPTDGQLTELTAEAGQSTPQGAVLAQVDSLDRFKLTALVDEYYLGRIVLGQSANFASDGRAYQATVAKVYPQVRNGAFRIGLHFENPAPEGIYTGQAFDIKLELGQSATALRPPNASFYQETGGDWIFVVAPDGRYVTRRNVRLGRRNPEHVEVLDGLAPGEKVIVSGYEAFQKIDRDAHRIVNLLDGAIVTENTRQLS